MNLGLFVLFLSAPILGYGAYMSSRGHKHDGNGGTGVSRADR
ncbi:hypothetical protein AB4Y32_05255 [Paraburkholderia phymatum]|uniref:Uncharacterized protein n=1 Tax=Paraburkholderia phymatum TaxID=148447 RepID=A0ACC6TV22_9BURK